MSNRLAKETSPYLLQHSENPVDWYPWGQEAIERAQNENKPILLSIGYSACHWCHVMEKESFENPKIAALMNQYFINIKVDREERPDLDLIYQKVAQALTRGGGWPLTVFLTPALKPFYGGTYFPPEDRYGRAGFARVLALLAEAYEKDVIGVAQNAQKLTAFIEGLEVITQAESAKFAIRKPTSEDFKKIVDSILQHMDWEEGGLSGAPKFPNPMVLTFLWRYGIETKTEQACKAVVTALTKMAQGGIYDQLGGGFHRYSVDAHWRVPHFEKMLYDNGLLLKLYSEVVLSSHLGQSEQELFLEVIRQTSESIFRDMTASGGAFYSAQDADSEGEEGKFFVWSLDEIAHALNPDEAKAFTLAYGVTAEGNFEHGKNILYRAMNLDEVGKVFGFHESSWDSKAIDALLRAGREKLLAIRSKRVAPAIDDKILASWNGLMISGLAWTSKALRKFGDEEQANALWEGALRAYQFIVDRMMMPGGRLFSSFQKGQTKGNAFLDDYAFMTMAALDLDKHDHAKQWINLILKHFKDEKNGGLFFTSDDHEQLIHRPKSISDQAIPAGNSVALMCMAQLSEVESIGTEAGIGADLRFRKKTQEEINQQVGQLFPLAAQSPLGMGEFLNFSWRWIHGSEGAPHCRPGTC